MILKIMGSVRVGDFIRVKGHLVSPDYAKRWHKVIKVESRRLTFVDRHGRERHWSYFPGDGIKFLTWQPGDNRNDDA